MSPRSTHEAELRQPRQHGEKKTERHVERHAQGGEEEMQQIQSKVREDVQPTHCFTPGVGPRGGETKRPRFLGLFSLRHGHLEGDLVTETIDRQCETTWCRP